MTILSILEKDTSSSLLFSQDGSTPSLESLTCGLKNVVWGARRARLSLMQGGDSFKAHWFLKV